MAYVSNARALGNELRTGHVQQDFHVKPGEAPVVENKRSLLVYQHNASPIIKPVVPKIPFLLRASVIAFSVVPLGVHAQFSANPVVQEAKGSNGRNANIFRSSTGGGGSGVIQYSLRENATLDTTSATPSIRIDSRGGKGGDGHHGVISDTSGSVGGTTGAITVDLAGTLTNRNGSTAAHGVSVSATGGDAGSRRRGGEGGGSAGPISVSAKNFTISTASQSAAGIEVNSHGGNGNSTFQAVGIRWSGSDGGNGGRVDVDFSGNVNAAGRGLDVRSTGGVGGNIEGGFIQTTKSHGGVGGRGGDIRADLTGLSSGERTRISTGGSEGHALRLRSQGGDGGQISGSSWFNGADGGTGGAGGSVSATLNNVTISTTGAKASGVLAESDGGSGFWGGGSGLARGGKAGSGGDAGRVTVGLGTNVQVTTTGAEAIAVQAVSRGGGGSNGGRGGIFYSPGGDGSSGGRGGEVALTNAGRVETSGKDAHALYAASLGGAAGGGGKGNGVVAVGGNGGANSHSSKVELRNSGTVITSGEASHGLFAESVGGDGGNYSAAGQAALGGDSNANSPNSHGGEVIAINSGSVTATGKSAKGILVQSIGGGGGHGGGSVGFVTVGGNGESSGNASTIRVSNFGNISTKGEQGYAVHAQSIGGGGGNATSTAAYGPFFAVSVGGKGGSGGNGGAIFVDLDSNSDITTSGEDATAVVAQSIGGGGGDGGIATATGIATIVTKAIGGAAGTAGHGGAVQINTAGKITTSGNGALGVLGQSVGGGGGIGGNGTGVGFTLVTVGLGGAGGSSGHGAGVTFTNKAQISTKGSDAYGALLQSVGGGGGAGGNSVAVGVGLGIGTIDANASVSIGGTGGDGGDAGKVQATNLSDITTVGKGAKALVAQSIGGGGGAGGTADAISVTFATKVAVSLAVAIGRSGGSGGVGGEVLVDNWGDLFTTGDHAAGLVAQSVGGGGGVGGGATTRAVAYGANSFAGALSVGGGGGDGGDGGKVSITQQGGIRTMGDASIGVLAQSIGGGGGSGGLTHGDTRADTANIALVLGRSGGSGGNGGDVSVNQSNTAVVSTSGISSDGIVVQSVGGGGGVGSSLGDSDMPPWPEPLPIPGGGGYQQPGYSGSFTLALGGKGGSGGEGGAVSVTQKGMVTTSARQSNGIVVQSIGGGGGRSGSSASSAPAGDVSLALTLGRSGGSGGDGGEVQVTQSGTVQTSGSGSIGLLAQSVGGGGGNGSASEAGQSAGKIGVNVAVGSSGGGGGLGGRVNVNQTGTISADNGDALVAQSIGGGGGYAGAINAGVSSDGTRDIIEGNAPAQGGNLTLSVGARGGSGGRGGEVNVSNLGTLTADGNTHAAALLQSIGGGGGVGGIASAYYETSTFVPTGTVQVSMAVGGRGGSGGDGGTVTWKQEKSGTIQADGILGDGVRLQSIGGGGGAAGGVAVGYSQTPMEGKARISIATISIGGSNGSSGNGNTVSATNDEQSRIRTLGNGGIGLIAQSIGGGGGLSYAVYPQGVDRTTIKLGGSKGNGGSVGLTQNGFINTRGELAHGILAQSIGGGGGGARVVGGNATTTLNADAAGQGDGGAVDLTVGKTGVINTQGAAAYGVLAQSIGGGGGYSSSAVTQAPAAGSLTQNKASSGDAGEVRLRIDGQVTTKGEGAAAVFAQSIGGGGGLVDGVAGRAGSDGTGAGGLVAVYVGGTVHALGKDASGIFAQSDGSAAGNLYVEVQQNGTVIGGSGHAAAIQLAQGKDNVIRILSGADVSAASGIAIRTTGASTVIDNQGTLAGSVLLEQGTPGLLDNKGTVKAGNLLGLTGGNFVNHGLLSIGTGTAITSSALQGRYLQNVTGTYAPKVDFSQGIGDVFAVTAGAQLDGKLAVDASQHLPGKTVTVLQAEGGALVTVQPGFYSQGNAVFDYPYFSDGKSLSVGVKADFARHNSMLSEDQSDVASYLGRKWGAVKAEAEAQAETSTPRAFRAARTISVETSATTATSAPGVQYAEVFDAVAQADDSNAYADVLDQIANDALQAPAAIIPLAHRMFLNRTMTCPAGEAGTALAQDDACLWGDIQGNWLTRRGEHHETGFDYDSVRYMIGGQRPLGNGWVAGGGVSYEDIRGKAQDVALRSSGHNVSGVAFIRKISGPWSYAGALSAGYGSYDTHRAIQTAYGIVQPSADWNAQFTAVRLQTAYTHRAADFYVKPALDVDVMYQRVPSYSEKNGGAFNLKFDSASEVRTMISPSIEVGSRINAADLAMRPYVGLGVNWMPNNDWKTDAALKSDDSGDSFRLLQSLPSVFAEYRLGLDITTKEGMLLRAEWRQRFGDRYSDRSAQLQLGMRF